MTMLQILLAVLIVAWIYRATIDMVQWWRREKRIQEWERMGSPTDKTWNPDMKKYEDVHLN